MTVHKRWRSSASVVGLLLATMASNGLLEAQNSNGLKIVVVEGDGAINNIQTGSGRKPVVEVRDEDDKPVAGARLKFGESTAVTSAIQQHEGQLQI